MLSFTRRLLAIALLLVAAAAAQQINLDTQVKGSRPPSWGTDSGAANAYAITTVAPLGPSLRTGSMFAFIAANSNSGASTLSVNGGSAIAIKKNVSTALATGDIIASAVIMVFYDGTNFQLVGNGAINFSQISGTLSCSQLPSFTGDVTNSSCAMTVGKVNGVSYPSGPSTHQVPVITASNTATYKTIPNCTDTSGNHLNYTQSSDAFSCGTSSSGGGGGAVLAQIIQNDTSTGTTVNRLAKNNGSNRAIMATTSDVYGVSMYGVCSSGCGTSGTATIVYSGQVMCDFDGSTTAGDVVRPSQTANGKCQDRGAIGIDRYDSQYDVGTVVSTNTGAGTYLVNMGQVGEQGFNSAAFMIPMIAGSMQGMSPSALTQTQSGMQGGYVNVENGVGLRFYGSGGSNGMSVTNDGTNTHFNGNSLGNGLWQFTTPIYFNTHGDGGSSFNLTSGDGSMHTFTMSSNLTSITFSGFQNDTLFFTLICQDGSGGHTISWPAAVKGSPGTIGSSPNNCLANLWLYMDSSHVLALGSLTY